MNETAIERFAAECEARRRITFADVKRLRRDIAPDGLAERAEVERLMALDAGIGRADASWSTWLVAAVVDFAVWGERPTGTVEGEAAEWLVGLIGTPATRAAKLIAREVAREADRVDAAIVTLADAAEIAAPASADAEIQLAA